MLCIIFMFFQVDNQIIQVRYYKKVKKLPQSQINIYLKCYGNIHQIKWNHTIFEIPVTIAKVVFHLFLA